MQSAGQLKKGKKTTIRYYVYFLSSFLPQSVSLGIGKKSYALEKDPEASSVYKGRIVTEDKMADSPVIVLTGTTTEECEYVTGEIRLWIDKINLGSYPVQAQVSKGHFKDTIGKMIPDEKRIVPEAATSKPARIKKVKQPDTGRIRFESDAASDDLPDYVSPGPRRYLANEDFGISGNGGNTKGALGVSKNGGRDSERTPLQNTIKNNPKKDPGGEVTVFYGTSRTRTGSVKKITYGSDLGELEQGLCTVSIPPGHKQGAIERPGKILWLFQRSENIAKHIVLTSVKPMPDNDYYSYLRDGIAKADSKAALIFVHGFNVTFEEAAWRCGQIVYDIPFPGITGFFSWPSAGDVPDYGRDVERADASVTCLTDFTENLVKNTGVKELHFIAHSMGNRVLTKALNQLVQRASFINSVTSIAQVVLAAPDIDVDVFDREIYPVFKKIGKRRTLYVSDQDMALIFSKKIRMGLKRVGQAGEGIYVVDGMDTIDASNVASKGIHHSYIFETKELLADLNLLLQNEVGPEDRKWLDERVKTEKDKSVKYWLFKE